MLALSFSIVSFNSLLCQVLGIFSLFPPFLCNSHSYENSHTHTNSPFEMKEKESKMFKKKKNGKKKIFKLTRWPKSHMTPANVYQLTRTTTTKIQIIT